MRTHKELKEFVKSLCADEADILMDLLPSVMKSKRSNQKIIKRERKAISCPNCGSISIKLNGTKDGKQRYYCKDCHKSFSDNNNSIVYKSRHTYDEWIQFINCELHDYTLKDEADAVSSTELTTLTSICAHEYFHAIMNIYGVDNDNGYQWFQECFASWAGVGYIGTTWHWPNVMSYYFLNTPGESLMSYSINERRYGSFLFVLTISQEFGGVNTIKEIIESAASGTYYGDPYGAINSGLQSINQSYTIGSAFY